MKIKVGNKYILNYFGYISKSLYKVVEISPYTAIVAVTNNNLVDSKIIKGWYSPKLEKESGYKLFWKVPIKSLLLRSCLEVE